MRHYHKVEDMDDVTIKCDGHAALGPGAEKGREWEGSSNVNGV